MSFTPMGELLKKARREGYAVPSFCVWDAESIAMVRRTASRLRAPVIIMTGPCELPLLSPAEIVALARLMDFDVPVALLLDHGDTPELAQRCMEAGYSSVMLDYSQRPYEENAAALRLLVEKARTLGVSVEGELGHVGKADAASMEGGAISTLTAPDEALGFVRETGIDALAVSIGNGHGAYTKLPQFDFERLARIAEVLPETPLVLHGGSGTPPEDLQRAISLGIAKVNVATEVITAYRGSLLCQWNNGANLWAPQAIAEAALCIIPVVEKWLRLTGAAGRA